MSMTPTQLYDLVRDMCYEDSVSFLTASELYRYMSNAETELGAEVGCALDTDSSITTVASTREYTRPSGTLQILRLEWNSVKLKKIDLTQLDAQEGTAYGGISDSGDPVYYYEFGDTLGLSPIPDSAKTVKIWRVVEPTALSVSSTSFTIPGEYARFLTDYCLWRYYMKDDNAALADRHYRAWEENKRKAKNEWNKRKNRDRYLEVKDGDLYENTNWGII